jgi:hypothetical protein
VISRGGGGGGGHELPPAASQFSQDTEVLRLRSRVNDLENDLRMARDELGRTRQVPPPPRPRRRPTRARPNSARAVHTAAVSSVPPPARPRMRAVSSRVQFARRGSRRGTRPPARARTLCAPVRDNHDGARPAAGRGCPPTGRRTRGRRGTTSRVPALHLLNTCFTPGEGRAGGAGRRAGRTRLARPRPPPPPPPPPRASKHVHPVESPPNPTRCEVRRRQPLDHDTGRRGRAMLARGNGVRTAFEQCSNIVRTANSVRTVC